MVTSSAGYEPNNNGRAERGIALLKMKARTMLMAVPEQDRIALWPAAIQFAASLQRRLALGKPVVGIPPFGGMVTARIKNLPNFSFAARGSERM